jgi:hypothetical protein
LAYLALPTLTLCLFVVFAALGAPNSPVIFPLALTGVSVALALAARAAQAVSTAGSNSPPHSTQTATRMALICAGAFVSSVLIMLWVSSVFFDNSWDGQCYHQETVLKIAQDWNPLRQLRDPIYQVLAPWFNAKGHEFIAVSLLASTGNIEVGKVTNLLLLLASFFLSFDFFERLLGQRKSAFSCAVLAAANPVSLVQLPTFYVDGAVASTYLCLLSSIGAALLGANLSIVSTGIICSVVILANLKLSADLILFVTLISTCLFITFSARKSQKSWKMLSVSAVAGCSALIVGINPYAMNVLQLLRHPTDSLKLNQYGVRVLSTCAPSNYFKTYNNQLSRIGASILAKTNNSSDNTSGARFRSIYPQTLLAAHPNLRPVSFENEPVTFPPPFVFDKHDLQLFELCDVRLGGFGPWFGEVLIAAVMLVLVNSVFVPKKYLLSGNSLVVLFMAVTVALSTLAIEHAWWARYAPILWFFVVFLILECSLLGKDVKGPVRLCAPVLSVLLFGNVLLVEVPNLSANWKNSEMFRQQLNLAKQKCDQSGGETFIAIYVPEFVTHHPAIGERFTEAKIPWKLVKQPPDSSDYCYRVSDLPVFCYAETVHQAGQ